MLLSLKKISKNQLGVLKPRKQRRYCSQSSSEGQLWMKFYYIFSFTWCLSIKGLKDFIGMATSMEFDQWWSMEGAFVQKWKAKVTSLDWEQRKSGILWSWALLTHFQWQIIFKLQRKNSMLNVFYVLTTFIITNINVHFFILALLVSPHL